MEHAVKMIALFVNRDHSSGIVQALANIGQAGASTGGTSLTWGARRRSVRALNGRALTVPGWARRPCESLWRRLCRGANREETQRDGVRESARAKALA